MERMICETFEQYIDETLEQVIISNSTDPERISKVKIRPVLLKGVLLLQATEFCKTKVFHKNYNKSELLEQLPNWFEQTFKQAELHTQAARITLLISKNRKVTVKVKTKEIKFKPDAALHAHNRKKRYILEEGFKVPFMVDLGIMTTDGKIVKTKYDKYKQINRFLEFIEDILPNIPRNKEISIIDFGCGKSYLTFAMYYYLKVLKGYPIRITGLDLKEDVIKNCNQLKDRYGYDSLEFLYGDIADYERTAGVDMVVTLHACDTATDFALEKAVNWGASVILCVPCCQHEVNRQLANVDLNVLFKHGLIKERMSALITDAIRAELLETKGYKVQILEFIDMEHTPKNILIRAIKNPQLIHSKRIKQKIKEVKHCTDLLNIKPALQSIFEQNENEF